MVDLPTALEGVSEAESLDELRRMFPDLCQALGLTHMVYHSLRAPSVALTQPVLLYTYEADWVGRYFANRYNELDPIVHFGRRSFLPLDWSEVPRESDQVVDFFRDSERHGVGRHGISIPIRGPSGERALFTVNSTATARVWEKTRNRFMPQFLTLGHFVHERAMRIAQARGANLPRLSPRERQCLEQAAGGKLTKQIAFDLDLTERTVKLYLTSARHKLNAATIAQAVATALSLELIDVY